MGLIITGIIISIILGFKINGEEAEFKPRARMFFGLAGMVIIVFGLFVNIKANNVGIVFNPFSGGVQEQTLGTGYNSKGLFNKVYQISTEIQEFELTAVTAQTKSGDWVDVTYKVRARIDQDQAFNYFSKYRDKKLVDNTGIFKDIIQQEAEAITIKYEILELLGTKRDEIIREIYNKSKERLLQEGIDLQLVSFVDTQEPQALQDAIAKNSVAKQEAETAKLLEEKAIAEGNAKIKEAEAEKQANDLKAQSITDKLLEEKFLEKWNGQLPTTMLNDNISTLFNITK